MNKFMKKLKNFLITATIFATSISFATSVHAVKDHWHNLLSIATDQGKFSTFENVYKNTDLVSKDDYLFAKAIDEKNEDYLAANCSNWKYNNKYHNWHQDAVTTQLIGRQLADDDFLTFLLDHGIITSAFRELFTWATFNGRCNSFVQAFHKRYPTTKIAPCGVREGENVDADNAYKAHQNDLLSIEWLTKMLPCAGPTNLFFALFMHSPSDDTEKFAAAANFLLDKGAKINAYSKITRDTIFAEIIYYHKQEPYKIYFLLTHGANPNLISKDPHMCRQSTLEFFKEDYQRKLNAASAGNNYPFKFVPFKCWNFIHYILELYEQNEGNLPPYEQICSQYTFVDPYDPDCCTIL